MKHSLELSTSRLILVGADSALLLAEQSSQEALAAASEAKVPTSWPPEHHDNDVIDWVFKSLKTLDSDEPWRMFYIVLQVPRTLIGTCGFKGPPNLNGCVEVGYSVLQEFRCRGLATEAVLKLIGTAFDRGAYEVAAETFPSLAASLRVMEKCGMTLVGEGADPGTVRYSVKRQ
jgi:[ribosomal protein S5]-alanine N-acetyltransferase